VRILGLTVFGISTKLRANDSEIVGVVENEVGRGNGDHQKNQLGIFR
jgi:hypothetical protein